MKKKKNGQRLNKTKTDKGIKSDWGKTFFLFFKKETGTTSILERHLHRWQLVIIKRGETQFSIVD